MRVLLIILVLLTTTLFGQHYQQPNAAQIKLKLRKLNVLGSVLYMAAHPDDENTRVITYMANERLATTAYLSLTRGDGGQNLIGPEIGELLGLIRTQELLAARRIDGGQQFFTRAIDFGFSKSAEEAFRTWSKDPVLSDVIRIFRQYQPDVIITRFPPDERAGHGHHTASAMLAEEAFDAAARADVHPDQAKAFGVWQPKRLYTNTGRWWNQTINEKTDGVLSVDVGAYNHLLGKSYTEISALSSSQHKSQGWGRRGERGYIPEFFEYRKGKKAERDFFDDIDITWTRVKGGERVKPLVDKAIAEFNEERPAALVPQLLAIRKEISTLPDGVWKSRKLQETDQLIQDCLGLFIEVTASHYHGSPGEKMRANLEVVNRAGSDVKLQKVSSTMLQWDTTYAGIITAKAVQIKSQVRVHPAASYSNPYWLANPHGVGTFEVKNQALIGLPENSASIDFNFYFDVAGQEIIINRPMIYKWVDPVKGELWRPVEIVPPVFVNPQEKVLIFNSGEGKSMNVIVKSTLDKPVKGSLKLKVPQGWRYEPTTISFDLAKREEEQTFSFKVIPPVNESAGSVVAVADVDGVAYSAALQLITYDHIPTQTYMPQAETNVVRMELKKEGNLIGYIAGAGDEIPAALRNMGYEVWEMKDEDVTPENLRKTDAIVLGIRAFNVNKRIKYYMDDLLQYVYNGGTLVVQYAINFDFGKEKYAPYPMKLSRERVTEEDAEVRFVKPGHAVLNTPNKITAKDFEGWVQERGLYFSNEWDPAFESVLSMNDKGETPKEGSLLIANYGQGKYVYTGLSFFRELPDGVTGAYKLFANIVSLGKASKKTPAPPIKSKTK